MCNYYVLYSEKSKASASPGKVRRWLVALKIKETLITMIERSSEESEFSRGYRQALDDFGITQLLLCIRNYSDADFDTQRVQLQEKEVKSLAGHLQHFRML